VEMPEFLTLRKEKIPLEVVRRREEELNRRRAALRASQQATAERDAGILARGRPQRLFQRSISRTRLGI